MTSAFDARRLAFAALILLVLAASVALPSDALAQANQGIDFTKANTLGNNWTTWIMGNPVTWFFTTAFVIVGIMAALNRAPWAWLLYIIIGAIIAMPVSTLVSNLNSFL